MNAVVIEKCEITSFGCISNKIITPTQGINLITAPNESGKTTLAHFIKFIFYGFAGQRVSGIAENEKKHYVPWDNPRAAGALEFSLGGVRYRIQREFLGGKDICTVTEKDTGKEIIKDRVPGEFFFNVKEEIFTKTAFLRQLSLPTKKDDELAEQLRNLVASADEGVSASAAKGKLNDAKNRLRGRIKGMGLIPEYEDKRSKYDQALNTAISTSGELGKVEGDIKALEEALVQNKETRKDIQEELASIEKYEAAQKYGEIQSYKVKVENAQKQLQESLKPFGGTEPAAENIDKANQLINSRNALSVSLSERTRDAKQAAEEVEEARKESLFEGKDTISLRKKISVFNGLKFVFALLFAVFGLSAGAVAASNFSNLISLPEILDVKFVYAFGIVAVVFLVAYIVIKACSNHFVSKNGFSSTAEMKYMLKQYPAAQQEIEEKEKRAEGAVLLCKAIEKDIAELDAQIKELTKGMADDSLTVVKRIEKVNKHYNAFLAAETALEKAVAVSDAAASGYDIEKLALAEGAEKPKYSREQLNEVLRALDTDDSRKRSMLREKEGERGKLIGSGGEPALIQAQRDTVVNRIKDLEQAHSAVMLAAEVLDEADKYMRNTVSPALSHQAGKYMSVVTGGKYSKVSLDTSLTMSYETAVGTKHSDYMSAGTRDSAYMCLRLALLKIIYSAAVPPLVLDDAFVRLDGKRLEQMLELVKAVATESQVFVFTCHDREARAFDKTETPYNRIVI